MDFDMPQPLSRVHPKVTSVMWTSDALASKPEMAEFVASIISLSTEIDHELKLLMARMLGAKQRAALAIYSLLETHRLERAALRAAAKATLTCDEFRIFDAVMSGARSAQSERHRLAHWHWGLCHDLPDALLLTDPKYLQMIRTKQHLTFRAAPGTFTLEEVDDAWNFDYSKILVYRSDDLERAKRDLIESRIIFAEFDIFLNPSLTPQDVEQYGLAPDHPSTRSGALKKLSSIRLFREALDRHQPSNKRPQLQNKEP